MSGKQVLHRSYNKKLGIGLALVFILQLGLMPNVLAAQAPVAGSGSAFFAETGHNLAGAFKSYWEKHGGLAQFGYPITEQFSEYDSNTKQTYTVQYFERARFELHPEYAGTENEVLLGLLGQLVAPRATPVSQAETPPGGTYFPQVGHTLSGVFQNYWLSHGGLPIYGYPLTEPFQEKNPDDGKTYLVQYFERNRLEWHPENAGTENEVLLGLLGSEIARQRGLIPPLPEPARPLPNAVSALVPLSFDIKGTAFEQTIHSPILNKDEPYRIYLPPNYNRSGQLYPVLYMLHGYSGVDSEWNNYRLFEIADQMILQGQIPPLIIVLPTGEQGYWVDQANGGPQWGSYVAHDVVGFIDANYRTIPDRAHRAIGGHSMGGHGALQIGMNYSSVFSVVGAHSPTLRTKDEAPDYFGDFDYYSAHDPVTLARNSQTVYSLKLWIDIGDQDAEWVPRAEELHQVLESRDIPHDWHLWPGGHDATYWIPHVPDYLRFYTGSFGAPR
jgi:enterochelin esterase-like enzyme